MGMKIDSSTFEKARIFKLFQKYLVSCKAYFSYLSEQSDRFEKQILKPAI
jgi:hypothetical protein